MAATLISQCGTMVIEPEELRLIPAPEPTKTWYPLRHSEVLDTVESILDQNGFRIAKRQVLVSQDQARMFATLDLTSHITPEVGLSVGVRNSSDKTFPLGFAAGNRVFVCDNLSFQSELIVSRKHTRFGADRFREAISSAVGSLDAFRIEERRRIEVLQNTKLDHNQAAAFMLRAAEEKIVPWRHLPGVLQKWQTPALVAFDPRNYWSLLNAFTSELAPVCRANPQRFVGCTIALQQLMYREISPGREFDQTT